MIWDQGSVKDRRVTFEPKCELPSKVWFAVDVEAYAGPTADVGTLPDGYVRTNSLPQVPTRQSVPTTRKHLPGYFGLPIGIPTLGSIIGPAIARVRTPWLSFH